MGYDMAAICEALAANLSGIDGLQESGYLLANPTPPAAEVEPGPIKYDRAAGRGLDDMRFLVRVFVGLTTDIGAQKRLYRMLASTGDDSIKTALESNRTLGGLIDDLWVSNCSGLKLFVREVTAGRGSAQGPLLGAEWTVQILATGA
ncbi:MAG TPA: hypothetical protein VN803_13015 [Gemmatimonadales bacterium]|nr:hypothetical protein [Gemmatimonadales bacterium]